MLGRWLMLLMLAGGCALAGCAASEVPSQDGERTPHGAYVGGSGGYAIR